MGVSFCWWLFITNIIIHFQHKILWTAWEFFRIYISNDILCTHTYVQCVAVLSTFHSNSFYFRFRFCFCFCFSVSASCFNKNPGNPRFQTLILETTLLFFSLKTIGFSFFFVFYFSSLPLFVWVKNCSFRWNKKKETFLF